jgi:hypothetical protein
MRNDIRNLVFAIMLVILGGVLHTNVNGQMGVALGAALYVLGGYFLVNALISASRPEVVEIRRVIPNRYPFWNPGWWGGSYRRGPWRGRRRRRRW